MSISGSRGSGLKMSAGRVFTLIWRNCRIALSAGVCRDFNSRGRAHEAPGAAREHRSYARVPAAPGSRFVVPARKSLLDECVSGRRRGDAKLHASLLLQMAQNFEEISRLRIPTTSEHPDQTFRLDADGATELFESDCSLDVIAQVRFAYVHFARQHQIDSFAQESVGKNLIGSNPLLDQVVKAARHRHFNFQFSQRSARFLYELHKAFARSMSLG